MSDNRWTFVMLNDIAARWCGFSCIEEKLAIDISRDASRMTIDPEKINKARLVAEQLTKSDPEGWEAHEWSHLVEWADKCSDALANRPIRISF